MLKAGDRVPDFQLPADNGRSASSAALAGQRYLLFFYPKDDTPGCTVEAHAFRDNLPTFERLRVKVYGISADDLMSHQKFARKHQLNFPLIADPNHHLIGPIGVWVEKHMYGKKSMGIQRSTFLVGADGVIEKVWERVNPVKHIAEVLEHLGAGGKVKQPTAMVEAVKAAVGMLKGSLVQRLKPLVTSSKAKPAPTKKVAAGKKVIRQTVKTEPAGKKPAKAKPAAKTTLKAKPPSQKKAKPPVKTATQAKASAKKTARPAVKTAAKAKAPAKKTPKPAAKALAKASAKKAPKPAAKKTAARKAPTKTKR